MGKPSSSFKKIVDMLAFFAIAVIAVVLLIQLIIGGGQVAYVFGEIAKYLAYFVCAVYAFNFVYTQRSVVYTVIYVAALVVIVVLIFV